MDTSGRPRLGGLVNNASTPRSSIELRGANKRKEREFRTSHGLLLGFVFLLIIVQGLGIFLFTNGFLLTRQVLDDKSSCSLPPIDLHGPHQAGSSDGCWHPRSFNKAVILIIDALRYDFTVPSPGSAHHYHNALPILHETALQHPTNAFLRPFIADPPTTTLQRLKGLTTGTLPTFIEAGSNFAGNAIEEDNLIGHLKAAGKNVVQLGDDTWQSLFPGHFEPDLTRPFDSFNVKDIHTVDNGVITHLMPLLHPANVSRWDVIIGHFLGVDHVGHNKRPDDPLMTTKLQQMNQVLTQTIGLLDDDTLMVVLGDHGMDSTGNHGGESDDEVEAALWMYSKRPFFGRSSPEYIMPPETAKDRPLTQIDLVPTLALLLGLPIPFNNLGAPIEEAFIGVSGDQWQNMAYVNRLASAQLHRFQDAYATIQKPDANAVALPNILWHAASRDWEVRLQKSSKLSIEQWRTSAGAYSSYQQHTLAMFRALWARFDVVSMSMGIAILVCALALVLIYSRCTEGDTTDLHASLCINGGSALISGGIVSYGLATALPAIGLMRTTAFVAALSSCIAMLYTLLVSGRRISLPIPKTFWSWMCFATILLLAGGFGSNSYTIWEEEVLLYILAAFGTLMFVQALRLQENSDRVLSGYHAIIFTTMIRLSSVSRVCREEQFPNCNPLFFASVSSKTSVEWRVALPFLVAVLLPSAIKAYFDGTHSYQGSAPLWIGIAFRASLFLIASFWTLRAINGAWIGVDEDMVEIIRTYLAQFILALSVGAGGATFGWQAPLIGVETVTVQASADEASPKPTKANGSADSVGRETTRQQVVVRGIGNLYGSHFSMLPFTVLLLPLLLVSEPMGQFSLTCVTLAVFSLLELLHLLKQQAKTEKDDESTTVSALGPTVLALLAHFAYFKTGHQAALASIQWESAFIATRILRYPWSPIFVTLNTFAGQILCAAAVPAVVLWRRPCKFTIPGSEAAKKLHATGNVDATHRRNAILSDLAKAQLTHFLTYNTINLATTVFAAHLRRHLMLYRVFCPRWMLGGVGMVIAELVGCFIGLAGVGWTIGSLGGLFDW